MSSIAFPRSLGPPLGGQPMARRRDLGRGARRVARRSSRRCSAPRSRAARTSSARPSRNEPTTRSPTRSAIRDAVTETVVIRTDGRDSGRAASDRRAARPADPRPRQRHRRRRDDAVERWSGQGPDRQERLERAHRRSHGRLRVRRPGSHLEGARARAVSGRLERLHGARDRPGVDRARRQQGRASPISRRARRSASPSR